MDLAVPPSFPADATHVPTFYVPDVPAVTFNFSIRPCKLYGSVWVSSHLFLLLVFGTIFGGIHCAGWYFPFPTYAKQELWRVASVIVTISPIGANTIPVALIVLIVVLIVVGVILVILSVILSAILSVILSVILGCTDLISPQTRIYLSLYFAIFKFYSDHSHIFADIYWTIYLFTYISARLLLLGLALALLRHQPPNVFITVDWTRFYPHIF